VKNANIFKTAALALMAFGVSLQPLPVAAAVQTDECSKELLLSYFPEQFVNETLSKFKVPQDQWAGINKELTAKDKEVVKLVEEKAAKLSPNPLKDPQQRQAAVKIFRETLLQIFGDVLKAHNIKDEKQIQAMLDDIQQQKARRFAQCMEKQKAHQTQPQNTQPPKNQGASNDEENDDSSGEEG
jgi:hypothetical protein